MKALALAAVFVFHLHAAEADLILHNGKVVTVDAKFSIREAVAVGGNRVLAVGCTLPLSDSPHISTMIHTRHKAAVGVTEQSDAVVVVVSEETGTISLAVEGRLERGLDADSLRERLQRLLIPQERSGAPGYRMLFRKHSAQQERQKAPAGDSRPAAEPAAQETQTGSGSA